MLARGRTLQQLGIASLLCYAGEVAVERGGDQVVETDVREAQQRLESDKIVETVKTLPYHQKLVLYVITSSGLKEIGTNEIYAQYKAICDAEGQKLLSKVRVSAFISELDMLGLISAKQQYKGALWKNSACSVQYIEGKGQRSAARGGS